jgi:Fe-S-cluster containining protein
MVDNKTNRDIACRRCGNCCHVDMAAYVSLEDIKRWEEEGCNNIIARLKDNSITWSHNRIINKFGSEIKTCLMSCVYLKWDGSSASCEIYETRTKVCRSYVPGSTWLCPLHHKDKRPTG